MKTDVGKNDHPSPTAPMRDSGIEWIGEIPEGWDVQKLKFSANVHTVKATTRERMLALEGIESWSGRLVGSDATYEGEGIAFQPGDVLFGKLRPYLAKVYLATFAGAAVGDFYVLRPIRKRCQPRFLWYQLLSNHFIDLMAASTYGAKMPRVSWDFMGDVVIHVPPIPEQRAIADFLDRETSRIDTLIAKRQRIIDLLDEKRSALITQAVTKGLDPTAPMRDSGIEWIGEIPEGWDLERLSRLSSKIGSGKTPTGGSEVYEDSGVLFIRSQNVHFNGLRFDDAVFISDRENQSMASTAVHPRDVLLNITGASIGRCTVVPLPFPPANVNQHVCIVRPISRWLESTFLAYALASVSLQEQIELLNQGTSRQGLNFDQVGGLQILLPTIAEQRAIADFLDRETSRIDQLKSLNQRQIELLKEKRQALITAAVTGKIPGARGAV